MTHWFRFKRKRNVWFVALFFCFSCGLVLWNHQMGVNTEQFLLRQHGVTIVCSERGGLVEEPSHFTNGNTKNGITSQGDITPNSTRMQNQPQCCEIGNCPCLRGVIGVHKMGLTATLTMMKKNFPLENMAELANNAFGTNFRGMLENPRGDYRMVVITRNWYDALISGYLYHKAGRECWVDQNGQGKGKYRGWIFDNVIENWQERINASSTQQEQNATTPWPNAKGRNLCTYLSQESEYDGMRVYTEWALDSYLRPLLRFAQDRKESERIAGINRTLFLCFRHLVDPDSYTTTVETMRDWLYSGRSSVVSKSVPTPIQKYHGKHGTSHNQRLRQRLRTVLEVLDFEVYNGEIRKGNTEFKCASETRGCSKR